MPNVSARMHRIQFRTQTPLGSYSAPQNPTSQDCLCILKISSKKHCHRDHSHWSNWSMVHFRYYKKQSRSRQAWSRRCTNPGKTEPTSVFHEEKIPANFHSDRSTFGSTASEKPVFLPIIGLEDGRSYGYGRHYYDRYSANFLSHSVINHLHKSLSS